MSRQNKTRRQDGNGTRVVPFFGRAGDFSNEKTVLAESPRHDSCMAQTGR